MLSRWLASFASKQSASTDVQHDGSVEEGNVTEVSPAPLETEFVYKAEASIYGLVVMPSLSSQPNTYLLLCVVYTLVISILSIIFIGVWDEIQTLPSEVSNLCNFEGDLWDCRPPGYAILLDFRSLDSDADGFWSLAEARTSKLLSQFKTVHEVILETPELLNAIVPPKTSQLSTYCAVWASRAGGGGHDLSVLSEQQQMSMLLMAGISRASIAALRPTCERIGNTSECYRKRLCPKLFTNSTSLSAASFGDEETSRSQYFEFTRLESVLPQALYHPLRMNLLQPCTVVDPLLCGNAEVAGWLAKVPMWTKLTPEKRVTKCEHLLKDVCPLLFGKTYVGYQVTRERLCGTRLFSTAEVPSTRALPSTLPESGVYCIDNDVALREGLNRTIELSPFMEYFWISGDIKLNKPPNTLRYSFTCDMGVQFGLCNEAFEIADPDHPQKTIRIGTWFGKSCAASCCKAKASSSPYSCPTQCNAVPKVEDTIDAVCVGEACSKIIMRKDLASQSLVFEREGIVEQENVKFIVTSNVALQAQFVSMAFPARVMLAGGDRFCTAEYLEIDGKRYCESNLPEHIDIPRRVDGITEIIWHSVYDCHQCHWMLLLSDAGESSSFSVSTMSFSLQQRFSDPIKGVMSNHFRVFFLAVLVLWFGFITQEVQKIVDFLRFILYCPSFPGTNCKRIGLLFGVWVPRFAILVGVLYVGILLLIVTDSLMEIVLNSVALAFLIDVDEYVYQWAATREMKQCLEDMKPYQWSFQRCARLVPNQFLMVCWRILLLAAPAIAVVAFQYTRTNGFIKHSQAADCLCGMTGPHCVNPEF